MLSDKKKGLAAIIIEAANAKHKDPSEGSDEEEASESSDEEGLESAADDIIEAVNNKDASQLVAALKNFMEMCG